MEEKKADEKTGKKHLCLVCARPSDTVICHACEDRIRGEVIDKKREAEKGKS
ncbi:MAG: hypothetical protein HY883_05085 [Deltaproteobacteria bacterium]|nr:hypothetical protein [Deltaproteobacteria bacterium]